MSPSFVPAAPGPCTAPWASSGVPAPDELPAALPGWIEPVRRSRAFRVRLAVAALTLLVVLTIYPALVVLTSYGVWCHAASPGLVAEVRRLFVDPGLTTPSASPGPF